MQNYFHKLISKKKGPLLISGPCSAENEQQVFQSIEKLHALGTDIVRFGVWKPRTRPGSFEGIGYKALEWIAAAKEAFPEAKVGVEIASDQHIREALAHNIDVVWIGARTTVNPFAVQELAYSLKGTGLPVMVKNPINPDLKLWMGAIERLQNAGVEDLAAVHRGFSTYNPVKYRNIPQWQIPIEFHHELPNIPMICDPSHIAGKRSLLPEVAQKALDLNFDGLMIEVHPDPSNALSDAEQQIKLSDFEDFLNNLVHRKRKFDDTLLIDKLAQLRAGIDVLDQEIIALLAQRNAHIHAIGSFKKENNVAVYQPERWKEIIETRPNWGGKKGLSEKFISDLYKLVHDESIKVQTDLLG